jgi:TolA-binding protein
MNVLRTHRDSGAREKSGMLSVHSTWHPAALIGSLLLVAAAQAPAQETRKPESPAAAVRQFRDAAAFQDRGLYDLAADEWQKFLSQFAADPLAPKARHYLGVCRMMQKQYDAAVEAFERLLRDHPDAELADSSYLNLGLAQFALAQAGKAESYDNAAKTFQTLVARFPKSKELPRALYYQGEALYARGRKAEAAKAYQQLVDNHREHPLRGEALYALGVARQDLGQTDAAAAVFDSFLQEFSRHALRAEVIMRRAETLFSERSFQTAAQWFASAAARPPPRSPPFPKSFPSRSIANPRSWPPATAMRVPAISTRRRKPIAP